MKEVTKNQQKLKLEVIKYAEKFLFVSKQQIKLEILFNKY